MMYTCLFGAANAAYLPSGSTQQLVCPYIVSGRSVAAMKYTVPWPSKLCELAREAECLHLDQRVLLQAATSLRCMMLSSARKRSARTLTLRDVHSRTERAPMVSATR